MSLLMILILVFAAGFFLGCAYFSLLWWTIQRLSRSERPVQLMTVSFLSRFTVALSVFFLVMDGRVERLLVAVLGFVVAREICRHFLSGGLKREKVLTAQSGH